MRKEGSKVIEDFNKAATLVEGANCPNCGERLNITNQEAPEIACRRCGVRVMLGTVEVKFQVVKRDGN